ncbi:MAG TPA: LysR family transcriptional regulator [Pseudolabrys sp.]|nr:LysR family transcriptional regulator [Pseudolabrys sp.]
MPFRYISPIMDLKEIRYFAQVARAGSFSRAADELRTAQPALSRKVRKLERELGIDLFIRHGRGVRLTNAGSVFLKNAEAIDQLVRRTGEQVRAQDTAVTGHAALGVPPAAGLLIAPTVVQRFQKDWPQVSLHVREGISTLLQEWVLDRRVDVAIVHNPPPLQALKAVPILTERMVLIGPGKRSGEKRPRESLRVRDLGDIPLIMPGLPHNNRRLLEQSAAQHGVRCKIVLEVDSVVLTKELVRKGLGYSLLTYSAVQDEVAHGEFRAYPIEHPPLVSTLAVTTLREAVPSPFIRDLILKIRETVRGLVQRGDWEKGRLSA